jgi:hypothetical protein
LFIRLHEGFVGCSFVTSDSVNRRDFLFSSPALAATCWLAAADRTELIDRASAVASALGIPAITSAALAANMSEKLGARLLPRALRPAEDFDDPVYYLPTRAEVETVFHTRTTLHQPWSLDVFDCEDFAYSLKVDVARHRYRTIAADLVTPMAFGILWGTDLPGVGRGVHVVNVVVTSNEGILLVDSTPNGGGINSITGWNGAARYIVI